ncbi:MAG: nitrile hydratase subunit beta [Dehalococcoidia bacterium]
MNGVHDMGGMHGFGPVEREEDEPVFHAPWEGTIVAAQVAAMSKGIYNIDEFRHARERMAPAAYLAASYYEAWVDTMSRLLVEKGFVTQEQLEERTAFFHENPDAAAETAFSGEAADAPEPTWFPPYDYRREEQAPPRFQAGDSVRTRNFQPQGHTRLARTFRDKTGVIDRYYGVFVFPDTHALGQGEQPQPLYSVRFEAEELWGESAERPGAVYADLWESYLLPD